MKQLVTTPWVAKLLFFTAGSIWGIVLGLSAGVFLGKFIGQYTTILGAL